MPGSFVDRKYQIIIFIGFSEDKNKRGREKDSKWTEAFNNYTK